MARTKREPEPVVYKPAHRKKAAFLAAYHQTGIIVTACREAEVPRRTYYYWTEHDPAFAAACQEAKVEAIERVEEELRRRALLKGPRHRDTTALIFYLKAHKPEKYRDNIRVTEERLSPQVKDLLRELAAAAQRDA